MRVSISQPRYLPWLGYMKRIGMCDLFIVLDTVQYTPRDWENRNKIRTPQGWAWLTVPVAAGRETLIKDAPLDSAQRWQEQHWKSIEWNYRKAAHFARYREGLASFYQGSTWSTLVDLDLALIRWMGELFGIGGVELRRSSTMARAGGKGSDLILDLCREVGATQYVSGPFGREYLSLEAFRENGIEILWDDYKPTPYPQAFPGFEPGLAAIDFLFNCGADQFREI